MTKAGHAPRHSRSNGIASAISGGIAALSLIVVAVTSLTPFRPPDWVVIGAFWLMLIGIAAAVVPGIAALAFVGAMFLGDGLLTAQGYQSGDSDIPVGVALRAGVPAVLLLITPAMCAMGFGLRARRLGMRAGAIPALVGLVVAAISILLNALPLALGL